MHLVGWLRRGRCTAWIARCALVVALVAALPLRADAQLSALELASFRIVYFEAGEGYLVPHAARTFLNSLAFQRRVFGFDARQKTTVLLVDFSDTGNAAATVVPRDLLTIQIAPLSFAFETLAANDRLNTIMNHELVHIATMDQAAPSDRRFRRLFAGKVNPVAEQPESIVYFFLTTPRVATPRWYEEGIAVFADTWMAGGIGRVQSGYDEMVFRTMVRDHTPLYDPLGLVSEGTKVDFQLQINSYLYGARFMTWLARHYSVDKLVEWVSRRDGSKAYYSAQFRHVFGVKLEDAWKEWVTDEQAFQERNLEEIRKYPLTSYRDVTARALGSVSRAYYDERANKIYAAFNYPGVVAHVGAISLSSGALERIVDIKGPVIYTVASLAFDPSTHTLFYTTDNAAHRDLMSLDPATHRVTLLQRDARIGELAFDQADRSIWGVRTLNGICTIVRIPPPYRDWQQIVSLPYGTVVYDLDVSPDGQLLSASFGEPTGQQDVRVLPIAGLLKKDLTPAAHFDFGPSVPSGFVFSPDGRYLYGSSYFTGVSNIFRYDLTTHDVAAMTNTDGGFFRPVPLADGRLLVFRYTGNGFLPSIITPSKLDDVSAITFMGERLASEQPVLQTWNVGSPAAIRFDSMPKETVPYRIARRLRLESAYPVVQGYKDTAAAGVRLNFSDPLQLNHASLTATVSGGSLPASERVHLDGEYERYNWWGRAEWNRADFYDLFGPTETSRKGYLFGAGHRNTLIFDEPRRLDLDVDVSYSGNLDRLPEYQNVAVDVRRLATVEARLNYTDVRNSLGYVDDETGRKWSLVGRSDLENGEVVPKLYGTFDRGWALPAGHSSLWIRSSGGFSPTSVTDPFANFYFGGFGNNWLDHQDEKRYREYSSLPGAEIDEIPGRNFAKSLVEWNLPPVRFKHAGTPGFYAAWMRPAVFAGGLLTNLDASGKAFEKAADLGAQLDFRFGVLSALDMTISIGGATAVRAATGPRNEAMLSVKILR
jgi:hypothetical protein